MSVPWRRRQASCHLCAIWPWSTTREATRVLLLASTLRAWAWTIYVFRVRGADLEMYVVANVYPQLQRQFTCDVGLPIVGRRRRVHLLNQQPVWLTQSVEYIGEYDVMFQSVRWHRHVREQYFLNTQGMTSFNTCTHTHILTIREGGFLKFVISVQKARKLDYVAYWRSLKIDQF